MRSPIVLDHLRCGSARFKLRAHLLQAHSKGFNLFLLRVNLATCFEELVEQHGVHLVVAHAVGFSLLSGSTSAGFTFATSSAIKPNWGVPLVSVL